MKKKVIRITALILAVVLAIDICASFYFYHVAVTRSSKDFLEGNPDLEVTSEMTTAYEGKEWMAKKVFENAMITSNDGLKLKAYYLKAKHPTKKTAIIAHGYASKAKDMGAYAKFYHEKLGFNVLMPDNRGHGESEGDYIGFGWDDRKDYLQWIDYVLGMNGEETEIILHGVSMGGAAVLMASGEKLPQNVKAIVSDCAYTSAEDVLPYRLTRMYNLPGFPILQSTSMLTKVRAGYSFKEASAIKQVAKTDKPVLFIHGRADTFVPVEMAHRLYNNTNSNKKLVLVPDAGHGNAYDADQEGYEKTVAGFLAKYMK
ncbi:alpha/beta hydrolase [Peribacillus glennii]|uniref:Alpha/beta hydrolase n=1 Tax=Peribacillus glennii TaxID=2303991 RepID=A0A372LAU9_9BACI|nr:alpha/beta hydrolase [Peribacillus glennii]RFU61993.1 alpha/beta hydrolase [Peribacillus glennii]